MISTSYVKNTLVTAEVGLKLAFHMTGAKARIGETTSTRVISSGAVSNGGAVELDQGR